MRQNNIYEPRNGASTVDFRCFALFLVERLKRCQQNQSGKRQPAPGNDERYREKRDGGQPVHGLQANATRQPCEKSVGRVHQHVFPDQRRYSGHDEKRCNDKQSNDALPEEGLIEQQRQPLGHGN